MTDAPLVAEALLSLVLMGFIAVLAVAILRVRGLLALVILLGAYSFIMATLFVVLDAVDVAMTEASVGAGISTVLFLGALFLTGHGEADRQRRIVPILVSGITAVVLVWGMSDLPSFGSADQPIHAQGADYLERSLPDTGIPNVVTAVLASYRGFDTLGETAVVFTAAIGVMVLLRRRGERS